MLSEVVFGLVGAAIGSSASLLAVYLTQNLETKREERKALAEQEEKAISEVYSPLVFVLQKERDLFASILALRGAYQVVSKRVDESNVGLAILHYTVSREAIKYPQVLEDLLLHKAGLIKSPFFYIDLVNLQSYLSTTLTLLDNLIIKSVENPAALEKCVESFCPIVTELDKAIGVMRTYSMQMTIRQKSDYKWFFDEKETAIIEGYIDESNKVLTGEVVPKWEDVLKGLKKEKPS